MEPNPRSFIVGIFVLTLSLCGVGFLVWYANVDLKNHGTLYQINFSNSVTGLRQNENVLYQGIPIGRVKKIKVEKSDIESVRVIVSIDKPQLIREDSVATIEAMGLTGVTFVQIDGSTNSSPILKVRPGEKYPIIRSESSAVAALFSEAPRVIEKLSRVAVQLEAFFSPSMIDETQQAVRAIRGTFVKISAASERFDALMTALQNSAFQFSETSSLVSQILKENRHSIMTFSDQGLPAAHRALISIEKSSNAFYSLVRDLERGLPYFVNKTSHQGVLLEE